MMDHTSDIYEDARLLEKKWLDDELAGDDRRQADGLLARHPGLEAEIGEACGQEAREGTWEAYRKFSGEKAYNRFLQKVKDKETAEEARQAASGSDDSRRLHIVWKWCAAAAVVLVVAGLSFWRMHSGSADEGGSVLQPGEQKGMLELADGTRIGIDKQDVRFVEKDAEVSYQPGQLSYAPATLQPVTQEETINKEEESYNSFVIPFGGENSVVLSDGTTVRLNAASKLTYPVRFAKGRQRMVVLEGEAFFDVKKGDEPFVVHTKYGDIRVLGTAFNVNAYDDNSACYTTLVRGQVCVTSPLSEKTLDLVPGQQAIVSPGKMEKREVEVEDYTGWVNGVYSFHEQTLENIMNTLKRWYAAEVVYDSPALCDLLYTGTVKRYEDINSFLDAFEMTGDLHYVIRQNTIYLYQGPQLP